MAYSCQCHALHSVTGPCRKKARIVSVRNGELDSIESQLPQPLNTVSDNKKWNSPSSGKVERRKVFRCLPMSCEAVAVTRMDGQRLYLSLKADADAEEKVLKEIHLMHVRAIRSWKPRYLFVFNLI